MHFLNGLLFGMTLQLSVGPVFFAVLHRSVKEGFREALKMVLGVAAVDAFYIFVSFTGVSNLLRIHFLSKVILFAGAGVLIYFGISYLKNAGKQKDAFPEKAGPRIDSSFIYGIKLTLTNPLTILFWSGTFGSLIASQKLQGLGNTLLYSAGCIAATLLFLTAVCAACEYFQNKLNNRILKAADYVVGVFLMVFAVKLILG